MQIRKRKRLGFVERFRARSSPDADGLKRPATGVLSFERRRRREDEPFLDERADFRFAGNDETEGDALGEP